MADHSTVVHWLNDRGDIVSFHQHVDDAGFVFSVSGEEPPPGVSPLSVDELVELFRSQCVEDRIRWNQIEDERVRRREELASIREERLDALVESGLSREVGVLLWPEVVPYRRRSYHPPRGSRESMMRYGLTSDQVDLVFADPDVVSA